MANQNTTDSADIRNEFNALREEVMQFMSTLKNYEEDRVHEAREKLNDQASQIHSAAKEKLTDAKKAGEYATQKVETQLRDHPLSSVALAFAAGFIASKLTRSDH